MGYTHPDGRKPTIPNRGSRDVPKGLLTKIIRYDLKMSMEKFYQSNDGAK